MVSGADDLGVGMLLTEFAVVADGFDDPVALQHRAVVYYIGRVGAGDLADDVFATYQR